MTLEDLEWSIFAFCVGVALGCRYYGGRARETERKIDACLKDLRSAHGIGRGKDE